MRIDVACRCSQTLQTVHVVGGTYEISISINTVLMVPRYQHPPLMPSIEASPTLYHQAIIHTVKAWACERRASKWGLCCCRVRITGEWYFLPQTSGYCFLSVPSVMRRPGKAASSKAPCVIIARRGLEGTDLRQLYSHNTASAARITPKRDQRSYFNV